MFLDPHGVVIVLGGTLTVALLCFPFERLFTALKIVIGKMLKKEHHEYVEMIDTIVATAQVYRSNPKSSLGQIPESSHPFFKEGMQMLVEFGFNYDDLERILQNNIDGKKKRDHDETKVWHTISRFPPAFGLLGATVGMISLLQTLGEPGAQDRIGPAMATALVATFYGLVFANLVFIPIAEKVHEVAAEDAVMRSLIKEGILMIQEKRHPLVISEYLKSFLHQKDRVGGPDVGGGSAKDAA
ncbi:MAG: motility protein A [Proteobacteria bacterium]|nr:motility protein A [Pseudomonadota bacterium]